MSPIDEAKARAAKTYNAAADHYDDTANLFWARFGRATIEGFNPWDRICDPSSLQALLREGGIDRADIVAESGSHPIPNPEAWWSAVLGSGYRGTVDQLDAAGFDYVRNANLNYIRASGVSAVEANVVYAIAQKE